MHRLVTLALLSLLAAPLAVSADTITLYDNTNTTNAATGTSSTRILIDDVLIPVSRDPERRPLRITEVSVYLIAVGSDVLNLWTYAPGQDGRPLPGGTRVASQIVDGPAPLKRIRFGDGRSTLFRVAPDFDAVPGFGLIYLGLNTDLGLGYSWRWADGPDTNLETAFLDNQQAGMIFLNPPVPGFPPHVSYMMEVRGSVPEPSSWVLLAWGVLALTLRAARPALRRTLGRL